MSVWMGSLYESEVIDLDRVRAMVMNGMFITPSVSGALPDGITHVSVREAGGAWAHFNLNDVGYQATVHSDGRIGLVSGNLGYSFIPGMNYEIMWGDGTLTNRSPLQPFVSSYQHRSTGTDAFHTIFDGGIIQKQLDTYTWSMTATGSSDPRLSRKQTIVITGSRLSKVTQVRACKATALGLSAYVVLPHSVVNGELHIEWPRIETDQHGLYQLRFTLSDQISIEHTMLVNCDRYFPVPRDTDNSWNNKLSPSNPRLAPMEARYFPSRRTLAVEFFNPYGVAISTISYGSFGAVGLSGTTNISSKPRSTDGRWVYFYQVDIPGLAHGSQVYETKVGFNGDGSSQCYPVPLALAFDDPATASDIAANNIVFDNFFEFKRAFVPELNWWQWSSNEPSAPHLGEPDNTDYAYPLNQIRNYQTTRRIVVNGWNLGPLFRVTYLTCTKLGADGSRSSGGISIVADTPSTDLSPRRSQNASWGLPTEYWSWSDPSGNFRTVFKVSTPYGGQFVMKHFVLRMYVEAENTDVFGRLRLNSRIRTNTQIELINETNGIPTLRADAFEVTANLYHDPYSSGYTTGICSLEFGTDWTIIPTVPGVGVEQTGIQSIQVYEQVHADNFGNLIAFSIPEVPILSIHLVDGNRSWVGGLVFRLLHDWVDEVGGVVFKAGDYPCVYDGQIRSLTISAVDGEVRIQAPVEIPGRPQPRGGRCRLIDLRSWVPEYLRGEGFEDLVGSFETYLNEMFEGPCVNNPEQLRISILQKIEDMSDLLDPNRVPIKLLHHLASNMGFDVANSILRSSDLGTGPADLRRYARMLVDSLPDIIRTKTTKDSMRGLIFCVGALANIKYQWTQHYSEDGRDWQASNENDLDPNLPLVVRQVTTDGFGPTPHFSLDIDLTRYDLSVGISEMTDLMTRAMEMVDAIRPVNTVIDQLSVGIPVEIDDCGQTLVLVRDWAGSRWDANPAEIPTQIIDEGSGILAAPHTDTIDELNGTIAPLPNSIEAPDGLI